MKHKINKELYDSLVGMLNSPNDDDHDYAIGILNNIDLKDDETLNNLSLLCTTNFNNQTYYLKPIVEVNPSFKIIFYKELTPIVVNPYTYTIPFNYGTLSTSGTAGNSWTVTTTASNQSVIVSTPQHYKETSSVPESQKSKNMFKRIGNYIDYLLGGPKKC